MYRFDRAVYDKRLAAATDPAERENALLCRWEAVKLAVAHCDVVVGHGMAFSTSVRFWHVGYRPPSYHELDDCTTDMGWNDSPCVHIRGDLDATLTVAGQAQVIIGGSIRPRGKIQGQEFLNVFVGGDMAGSVATTGSGVYWINGNLTGQVVTGNPSTNVSVMGHWTGSLRPAGDVSLLWVDVNGFMSHAALEAIADLKYTQFNATIGASDEPEGIYPMRSPGIKSNRPSGMARWVVHSFANPPA